MLPLFAVFTLLKLEDIDSSTVYLSVLFFSTIFSFFGKTLLTHPYDAASNLSRLSWTILELDCLEWALRYFFQRLCKTGEKRDRKRQREREKERDRETWWGLLIILRRRVCSKNDLFFSFFVLLWNFWTIFSFFYACRRWSLPKKTKPRKNINNDYRTKLKYQNVFSWLIERFHLKPETQFVCKTHKTFFSFLTNRFRPMLSATV